MPQTDGRTLREPRGEIYLQIIQQKWREEEEEEEGERVETRESSGKKSRGWGTEREARAEPGCAKRQASLRQAHREQTESVHWKCNGANSAQPA